MRINKYHIIYALALICVLTSCKVRRPNDVIPEDRMEKLLYDYHIAKAMGENLPYSENYKKALYVEYVFQKHGTTEAVFDSSMVWYTRNASVLSKVYERVNKKIKAEQAVIDKLVAIRDNKPEISAPGDSIDIWLLERLIHLTGSSLNNKLTFSIPSDSNFKARDTLQWSVMYHFPGSRPDSTEAAIMSMAVQYTNDSIITQTNRVLSSGLQRIRLQSDTLGDIKEVRGFIYYSGGKDSVKTLFANEISLIRYHSNDTLFTAKPDSVSTETEKPQITPEKEKSTTPVESTPATPVQQPERVSPNELRRRGERPRPIQRAVEQQPIRQEEPQTSGGG